MDKELEIRITANIKQFSQAMKGVTKRVQEAGKKMQSAGKTMTTHVTLPAAAMGAAILKTAADFESSMLRVKAVSGATSEQFEAMQVEARKLGATTQFSASQAADGMNFLAMAGFETEKIIAAMPATLNLAASAQLDMGSAADIVSNIMAGFNMQTSELSGAVDVLAKQFTSSNTDLLQLGDAMKFVAPVAEGLGFSFEETSAAVGLLSNAGLQAGMAGRGLRMTLLEVSKKADEMGFAIRDASGNMLPLNQILDNMAAAGIGAETVMKEFSSNSATALSVLLKQGGGALKEQTELLEGAGGTAKELADIRMKGLSGALKKLRSAAEELALSIADSGLLEYITDLVGKVTDFTRKLGEASPEILRFAAGFTAVAAAIGPLLVVLGFMVTSVLPGLVTAFTFLTGPIGLVILAIAALAAAFIYVRDNWDAIVERFSNITFWKNAIIDMINFFLRNNPFAFIAEGYVELVALFGKKVENPFDLVADGLERLKSDTDEYENDFGSFGDAMKNTAKEAWSAFNKIGDAAKETTDDTKDAEDAANDAAAAYKKMANAANAAAAAASNAGKTSGGGDPLTPDNDFADKQGVDDFNRSMAMLGDINLALQKTNDLISKTSQSAKKAGKDTRNWSDGLKNLADIMQGGLVDAFQTMLSGGQNAFKAFGDLIKQLITKLVAAFIVAAALSLLLPAIFGKGGSAGFGSFGALLGNVSGFGSFADGGIVSGPTLGLVGEYAGASSNPEVIAPLDKLQGMMAGAGGNVTVTGKISGQDILLSNERASNRRTRQRGF